MRPATRLFETIQLLRAARRPMTAQEIAETLEVSPRTVYRDIAALQAMRTPIEGEAGIGYVMRPGYDLPPLDFDTEEVEALVVALSLLGRTGDWGLQQAAKRILAKIESAREGAEGLLVAPWGAPLSAAVCMVEVRQAIRDERKLRLVYADVEGRRSERVVQPVAVIYHVEVVLLAAWCELRRAFRHFRVDRVETCTLLEEDFRGRGAALREAWAADQEVTDAWRGGKPF